MKLIGQEAGKFHAEKSEDIVTVDGVGISKKAFDIERKYNQLNTNKKTESDDEILDKLIAKQVVLNEAAKCGIEVSDDMVNESIKLAKQALEANPNQYNQLKQFISGLGIDEDTYWQEVKPIYRKLLVMGQYKNIYLKEKFRSENNITDKEEFEEKYKQYQNDHVNKLKASAKIEYKNK